MSLLLWAQAGLRKAVEVPIVPSYTFARMLDRAWGSGAGTTPGSGGGNVSPDEFQHEGNRWQLYQVVPFIGAAVSAAGVGRCRVHLRNRGVNRGAMTLGSMPSRIIISATAGQTADWTDLPWEFIRPATGATFSNPGSGNSARKSLDYNPVRNIGGLNPTSAGVARGETFTVTLYF